MTLINKDCLAYLRQCKDAQFTAACFSPPYAASSNILFDARTAFKFGGAFLPYALELSRTCTVWAVNFTQLVDKKRLLPFTEELVIALAQEGVQLFDRWVMYKASAKPQRGNRGLSNFEFVLLFAKDPLIVPTPPDLQKCKTAFAMENSQRVTDVSHGNLGLTPYSEVIPRQVFSSYGAGGTVLDPFCGTGTSLLVAKSLGLKYVGVDIEPLNIELCKQRGLR